MTRIVSYSLYQCPMCDQVHIKPNYGSVSSYIPVDLFLRPSDIKTCQHCRAKLPFERYKFIGTEREKPSKPNFFYEREIGEYLRKCVNFVLRKKPVECESKSLSERYPRLLE